jgi:hypothetical protein
MYLTKKIIHFKVLLLYDDERHAPGSGYRARRVGTTPRPGTTNAIPTMNDNESSSGRRGRTKTGLGIWNEEGLETLQTRLEV